MYSIDQITLTHTRINSEKAGFPLGTIDFDEIDDCYDAVNSEMSFLGGFETFDQALASILDDNKVNIDG